MTDHIKPKRPARGADPVRAELGVLFDEVPKATWAAIALDVVRVQPDEEPDPAIRAHRTRRRLLRLWEKLAPIGLPLPRSHVRAALLAPDAPGPADS